MLLFPGVVQLYSNLQNPSRSLLKVQALRPRSRPAESEIAGLGAYETCLHGDWFPWGQSDLCSQVDLDQGFSTVGDFASPPGDTWQCLEMFLGCHNSGSATGI